MGERTSLATKSISTTTSAIIITGGVVLLIAGHITAYHFGRIKEAARYEKIVATLQNAKAMR